MFLVCILHCLVNPFRYGVFLWHIQLFVQLLTTMSNKETFLQDFQIFFEFLENIGRNVF